MLGQIEPEGDRALFRILLRFADHDFVAAETSCSPKAAIARVGAAVQQHAGLGPAAAVILQRHSGRAAAETDAGGASGGWTWEVVERWDRIVVDRIRGQCAAAARAPATDAAPLQPGRLMREAPPAEPEANPVRPQTSSGPDLTVRNAGRPQAAGKHAARDRLGLVGAAGRPGHRWETGVSIALAAGAWLMLAAALTGGRLSALAGFETPQNAAVATELPVAAPDAAASAELPAELAYNIGIDG